MPSDEFRAARVADALLERLAAERTEDAAVETYSNGVRHLKIPDPVGNAIAFAEPPDGLSSSAGDAAD
jgi:gamma-glutamyl phosphate reductase